MKIASHIANYALAFCMQIAASELIDLTGESEQTLQVHGVNGT